MQELAVRLARGEESAYAELYDRCADREVIELKLYSGLTFRELAELLNQPPGTVATRYRRALITLRGWLEEEHSRGLSRASSRGA